MPFTLPKIALKKPFYDIFKGFTMFYYTDKGENNMNPFQILNMLNQIQSNPMQMLSQKFNIPDGVNTNDPNAILNHLINSNQVSQNQINSIKNNPMLRQFMR